MTAYFLGARHFLLSSTYLSSDIDSRLVQAAGTIVNLLEAVLAWLLLRRGTMSARLRYFFWLLLGFNLLDGTGYFIFSAVSNTGDWAQVIRNVPHANIVRFVMAIGGAAGYYFSSRLCARWLVPFAEKLEDLSLIPYWTVLVLNCAAAALNPLGVKYVLVSALPASAGANAALVLLPHWARRFRKESGPALIVTSNVLLVIGGLIAAAIFMLVLGPGIKWDR